MCFPGYGQMQRIQGGRKRSGRRGKVISPLDWCKAGNAHRRCPRRAHKTIRSVVYLCAPHNWGEPILPEILLTLPAKNCHPQNLLNWRIRRCFLLSSFHRRDRRFCLFHLPSHPHFSSILFTFSTACLHSAEARAADKITFSSFSSY